MLYIIRNNSKSGPYDLQTVLTFVNNGQILLCDRAEDANTGEVNRVSVFLKKAKLKPKIVHNGNVLSQLKKIGRELILPKNAFSIRQWKADKNLLLLTLVGVFPLALMLLCQFVALHKIIIFYAISLYFSAVWGLFFVYLFRTAQVKFKTAISLFFGVQIFIFVAWDFLSVPALNPFYQLINSPFPLSILGFTFGVGLTEEFAKLLPLILILKRAKEPLVPKTMVFYGLISGIAFGVFEGVEYQLTINATLDYQFQFLANIARLTSLPFLHAIWCGIAGYFLSLSTIFPKYRRALWLLAISVPAILHGIYDSFPLFVGLPVALIAIALLSIYLSDAYQYQNKLRN